MSSSEMANFTSNHNSSFQMNEIEITQGCLLLFFCTLGMIGNTIAIKIFSHSEMQCTINILLCGLGIADFLLLFLMIPVIAIPCFSSTELGQHLISPNFAFFIVRYLTPPMRIAQTASNWVFIVISFERYVAVCRPFRKSMWATKSKAKRSIIALFLLAIVYNLVRFFQHHGFYWLETQSYCLGYDTILYLITHFAIPFGFVLGFNLNILNGLKVDKSIQHSISQLSKGRKGRGSRRSSTTLMILVITFVFVSCNTLPFVLKISEAFEMMEEEREVDELGVGSRVLYCLSNVLIAVNSSAGFFIYLVFCKKFRTIFLRFSNRRTSLSDERPWDRTPSTTGIRNVNSFCRSPLDPYPSFRSRVSTCSQECGSRPSSFSSPVGVNR